MSQLDDILEKSHYGCAFTGTDKHTKQRIKDLVLELCEKIAFTDIGYRSDVLLLEDLRQRVKDL